MSDKIITTGLLQTTPPDKFIKIGLKDGHVVVIDWSDIMHDRPLDIVGNLKDAIQMIKPDTRPNDAKNPDGVQMIKSYLESNGFDGLYTDECGCELSDLMPCGGDFAVHCQAGYKTVGDFEFDGEKCDWFIGKDKPKQSREGEE